MSLAKLKAKETKGKQKQLPKLKTILANPSKKRCPTLEENELELLQNIIKSSIDKTEEGVSKFATNKKICLGLESSLRCINNGQSSCILISLSIKPIHIVSLIARNAEVKDQTQPVFAQPGLEEFTEKLFGVRALCMVLPKDLQGISEDLCKWVEQRRKPKVIYEMKRRTVEKCVKKEKRPQSVPQQGRNQVKCDIDKEKIPTNETKSLEGDFISFGKDNMGMGDLKVKDDRNEALNALTQMMTKIPNLAKTATDERLAPPPMEVEDDINNAALEKKESGTDDSVDFLDDYKALIVHKIKANPNKKPKKKRNKNKNKIVKK